MRTLIIASMITCISVGQAFADGWWEKIKFKGDFRYRHEAVDQVDREVRHRHKFRVRVGLTGQVSERVQAVVQLASGNDNPVSTNQTLTDGYSSKGVRIDKAYVKAGVKYLDGLSVQLGKFSTPFFYAEKTEMLWDSDLRPEGGVVTYKKVDSGLVLQFMAAGLWIEERSTDVDSWMLGTQGMARIGDESATSVAVAAGYFDYQNTRGYEPFFDGNARGNSVVTVIDEIDEDNDTSYVDVYSSDYDLIALSAEVTHMISNLPLVFMGEVVHNLAADSVADGWLIGARIGKTKKTGSWKLRYIYRHVEKDAVLGTFVDSDFRGGGSDAEGHEINAAIQIAGNTTFAVTYFDNTIGLNADEDPYRRAHFDIQVKF